MRKVALVVCLLLCVPAFAKSKPSPAMDGMTSTQPGMAFPTNNEINLMLIQTEQAMQQYKPLIEQEEIQLGANYITAAAADRSTVSFLEIALKNFKSKPQLFNSPAGFLFVEGLTNASRNAALCGSGAETQGMLQVMDGHIDNANSLMDLGRSCIEASKSVYTVSENADSLYQRYVEAEAQLSNRCAEAVTKCVNLLKENGVSSTK